MHWCHWYSCTGLQYLDSNRTYAFPGLQFNTIRPGKLDFLTSRAEVLRMGGRVSSELTVSLSPKLFTLCIHDCAATSLDTGRIEYADDTSILGLIKLPEESTYRHVIKNLTVQTEESDLFNIDKTSEIKFQEKTQLNK